MGMHSVSLARGGHGTGSILGVSGCMDKALLSKNRHVLSSMSEAQRKGNSDIDKIPEAFPLSGVPKVGQPFPGYIIAINYD